MKIKDRDSVSEENTEISKAKAIIKDKGKLSQAEEVQICWIPFERIHHEQQQQQQKINEKGPFT